MSRPIAAWEALIREATSADYDEMQDAMFRLSLVLERHNYPHRISEQLYEEYLSRDLLRLTLDERRQREVVDFLVAMTRARRADADTFLFALARVRPDLIAEPLLRLMRELGASWNDEAKMEALNALNAALKANPDGMVELLRAFDPSDLLDEWAQSDDQSLADEADLVLSKVEKLLGDLPA
ncbi:hypothetical protein VZO05_03620 [Aggregatilineales bacterium SYSU G02658]